MFKLQIRTDDDRLLTEWFIKDDEDGSEADVVKEIGWLRGGVVGPSDLTHAEALAE